MELNMEELERKIAEDVMKELEAKGATIIPQVYEGTHNTLKAIAKYDDFLVKHGVEKERIHIVGLFIESKYINFSFVKFIISNILFLNFFNIFFYTYFFIYWNKSF